MKSTRRFVALLFLIAVPLTFAQNFSSSLTLTLISSPDAPGNVSTEALRTAMERLAREWKLNPKDLPHVLVLHTSRKEADAAFVTKQIDVRRNRGGKPGEDYYEIWLVGDPKLKYVLALQDMIEYHFHLQITDAQRDEALARVMRQQDATVSAYQGR